MKHFIFGAGSYCETVIELASDCGFVVDAIIDDDPELLGETIGGSPVVNRDEAIRMGLRDSSACVAIGSAAARRSVAEWLGSLGTAPWTLVHPQANMSSTASVGPGCIIHRTAFVWTQATLGPYVILSPGSHVAHHARVGAYSMISVGATVGARVEVGHETFFGLGSIAITGIRRVGNGVTVGAGAVVIRDVRDEVTVVGVPAHEVRKAG